MYMNEKRIFIIVAVIIVSLCSFRIFNNQTIILDGLIIENEKEEKVELQYKNKRINELFNIMNGFIEVNYNNKSYKYYFKRRHLFKEQNFDFIVVDRVYGTNEYEYGYAFFDDKKKNIVVITDKRAIYAANDIFIKDVEEFYSDIN